MPKLSRRQFLQGTLGASALAVTGVVGAHAQARGAMVTVRKPDGTVLGIDPHTGATVDARNVRRASRTTSAQCRDHAEVPDVVEGAASFRQHWAGGDAHLLLAGHGDGARWWYWRPEVSTRVIDLPRDLEPAFATETCARWYHGAQVDAAHLGAGSLRLLAVDLASGGVALDRAFDRRLELAATAVSDEGAAVAHVQGGNTRLDLWLADLRVPGRENTLALPIEPAPVAPAAIDLRTFTDGDRAVLVAGASWSYATHPDPMVVIMSMGSGEPAMTAVPGEVVNVG